MLDKLLEETKRKLLGDHVCHHEGPPLCLRDFAQLFGEFRFHLRPREITRELFPKRHVGGLRELEDFSGENALRDEARFFRERELGRIAAFHEPREHLLNQCRARSEFFVEMVLNETGNGVVKAVGERERRASLAVGLTIARADVREKIFCRIGGWRFGKSRSHELSAMVIRAADENLFPRFAMGRLQIVPPRELLDLLRCQRSEELLRELAQKRVAQTVDRLEMFEEQNKAFEV